MNKLRIKKGDQVRVISGQDKGKIGMVLFVFPKDRKIIVSGVNVVKIHQKPSQKSNGGFVSKESKIDISNVQYFDIDTKHGSKVGYTLSDSNIKVRILKKSKNIISK